MYHCVVLYALRCVTISPWPLQASRSAAATLRTRRPFSASSRTLFSTVFAARFHVDLICEHVATKLRWDNRGQACTHHLYCVHQRKPTCTIALTVPVVGKDSFCYVLLLSATMMSETVTLSSLNMNASSWCDPHGVFHSLRADALTSPQRPRMSR